LRRYQATPTCPQRNRPRTGLPARHAPPVVHIDLLFSSDLQRATQTAHILAAGRELLLQTDPRLRELHFGVLEGHTFDEGLTLWPEMIRAWVLTTTGPRRR